MQTNKYNKFPSDNLTGSMRHTFSIFSFINYDYIICAIADNKLILRKNFTKKNILSHCHIANLQQADSEKGGEIGRERDRGMASERKLH